MRRLLSVVLLAVFFLHAGCSPPEEPTRIDETASLLPAFAMLEAGWNRIAPGGNTMCSEGSPYAFYVRPGDADRLLVYFQGGGACWMGTTCALDRDPTYDPVVDARDDPNRRHGIFAFDHPENPFADYTAVFVPYCTGDVHIGDRAATYDVPATDSTGASQVTVQHRGYDNASAVLDWVTTNVQVPQTVFVAGSSAGAIPAPFYAAVLAQAYPEARLAVLGDAAGAYRSPAVARQILGAWGTTDVLADDPAFADVPADSMTFERFYTTLARQHPDIALAQYNTAEDDVQRFFLSLTGVETSTLQPYLDANLADIRMADDDFRVFTAGGTLHTILMRPQFYTYSVGDRRVRDWVAALEAGEPVPDVVCTDCATADSVMTAL